MTAKLTVGTNAKLGREVASWSRPVGPTCPETCPFLRSNEESDIPLAERCYAESIELRRPNVREAWAANWKTGYKQWAFDMLDAIVAAAPRIKAVRIHVGGDFVQPGEDKREVDDAYVDAVLQVVAMVNDAGLGVAFWFYTHAWRELAGERYRAFREAGVHCFASVHSEAESYKALNLGWERLAIDPGLHKAKNLPIWTVGWFFGTDIRALTCPEQRGRADCSACGYCFRETRQKHVAFYRH